MIGKSWQRILSWLESNGVAPDFNEPATAQQFASVERAGLLLPPELVSLYTLTNGATSCAVFPSPDEDDDMAFTPMPLDEVIIEWENQNELVKMGQFEDCEPLSETGISNDWWNSAWIPFASNGGGDLLCIDTAPEAAGQAGQVISYSHETGRHNLLAGSLSAFVSRLASDLEAGKFEYDSEYGVGVPSAVSPVVPESDSKSTHVRNPWSFESEVLPAANEAFKNKDYAKCVEILGQYEDMLSKAAAAKLALARKRC